MICCGGKVEVATASANDVVFGGVVAGRALGSILLAVSRAGEGIPGRVAEMVGHFELWHGPQKSHHFSHTPWV